jgi:hypothetical protein
MSSQQPATSKNGSSPSSTTSNSIPACQHIKANGLHCGSPAMNHSAFCYFHTDVRLRRKHKRIPLPIVEDANSVQLALNQVAARIMDESTDLKRTGQLLYFLQLSSQNIIHTRFQQILSHLRASLARDYTPAMEAELQASTSGLANTPAAQADMADMIRHRDEWIKEHQGSETAEKKQPGRSETETPTNGNHEVRLGL